MNILSSAFVCWVVGIRRHDVLLDSCVNLDVVGPGPQCVSAGAMETWVQSTLWGGGARGLHPWEGWTLFEELVLNNRVGCYRETVCPAFSAPLPYCDSPVGSLEVEHVRPPDLGLSTPQDCE